MWTDTTRKQFARGSLRLPSDLTDAEWAVLEPLFPARSHRGRPPVWSYRQIVEALLYLLRGLPWRMFETRIVASRLDAVKSAENCRRVARRMSFTPRSPGVALALENFALIFVP